MRTWQVRCSVCDLLVLFVPHIADESLRTCCDKRTESQSRLDAEIDYSSRI